jgi:hypothetical protein
LLRWVSPRTIKETFVSPTDYRYPFLEKDLWGFQNLEGLGITTFEVSKNLEGLEITTFDVSKNLEGLAITTFEVYQNLEGFNLSSLRI